MELDNKGRVKAFEDGDILSIDGTTYVVSESAAGVLNYGLSEYQRARIRKAPKDLNVLLFLNRQPGKLLKDERLNVYDLFKSLEKKANGGLKFK